MSLTTSNYQKQKKSKLKKFETYSDMKRVAALILSGGEGSRLFPLTLNHCKPAIHFGGRYRLIDVPLSNSINSGCKKIFVLTQFLSSSLHQHIFKTYGNSPFNQSSIELLTAEQKPSKSGWFKGTADAVRQNLEYLIDLPVDYFLILSGDQLYNMDYTEMLQTAQEANADLVVAALPIKEEECARMGILRINKNKRITHFVEKPKSAAILGRMKLPAHLKNQLGRQSGDAEYLASMGIYLFKREALFKLLLEDLREDFGKHLIPTMVERGKAVAYLFDGYWEDIGTIESFYKANIALTQSEPYFNFYNEHQPIYTNYQHLAGPKIANGLIKDSIICEGCIIQADEVKNSILGPRTIVGKGSVITDSYIMGNDYYELPLKIDALPSKLQIGQHCIISKAIIDKNVVIGDNVRLINKSGLEKYDCSHFFVRDGIIIVPRGVSIPDGLIF